MVLSHEHLGSTILKCGFCKKSFIMNDFLRNPHFSQKCHFWSYFMLKLFVNIWYTSSTSQSTQASFLHKPHGVSMLTFDSFWLFNQNQNKHKQHGVSISNGYYPCLLLIASGCLTKIKTNHKPPVQCTYCDEKLCGKCSKRYIPDWN